MSFTFTVNPANHTIPCQFGILKSSNRTHSDLQKKKWKKQNIDFIHKTFISKQNVK